MPVIFIYPRMPRKQIELWGIKSTSGNFRPYQIQTADIHFKGQVHSDATSIFIQNSLLISLLWISGLRRLIKIKFSMLLRYAPGNKIFLYLFVDTIGTYET